MMDVPYLSVCISDCSMRKQQDAERGGEGSVCKGMYVWIG